VLPAGHQVLSTPLVIRYTATTTATDAALECDRISCATEKVIRARHEAQNRNPLTAINGALNLHLYLHFA